MLELLLYRLGEVLDDSGWPFIHPHLACIHPHLCGYHHFEAVVHHQVTHGGKVRVSVTGK